MEIFQTIQCLLIGLFTTTFLFLFSILSLPIYVYRFLLTRLIVPYFFHNEIGNPVSSIGNVFATEFIKNRPPRAAIVTNFVVDGAVTDEEVIDLVNQKWIKAQDVNGNPTYPEFQQYVEYWKGFMFWKHDKEFSVRNHVRFHKVEGNSDDDSEKFVCTLMESLLNKRFTHKRSPWEINIVRNYSNSQLRALRNDENGEGELTVFVLRFHHALADGFSILYAVMEGLFEMPLSSIALPSPSTSTQNEPLSRLLENFKSAFTFPLRVLREYGFYASLALRPKTPWHAPDRQKSWNQLYGRSNFIPIRQLKEIKDKLGVSFTGVLLSCISAGIAKSIHSKTKDKPIDAIAALIPLPLPGHPMKLRNHVPLEYMFGSTGTNFDLPINPNLSSMDRLIACEENLRFAKSSAMPLFAVIFTKLFGSHLAPVARKFLKNAAIPTGLTNFPGPGHEIVWNGRRGLAGDFAAGAVPGVAGVGFMVLSYGGFIRIAATAESAVMDRDELNALIQSVCDEINLLKSFI